jgi:hypothetical protein
MGISTPQYIAALVNLNPIAHALRSRLTTVPHHHHRRDHQHTKNSGLTAQITTSSVPL